MSKIITLDQKLRFIGFRINVNQASKKIDGADILRESDIERTLIEAAYAIQKEHDYRLFSILLKWIEIFGEYVIVEKFEKFSKIATREQGLNPILNAIAVWGTIHKQTKWNRLIVKSKANAYIVDKELTDSSETYPGLQDKWLKYGVKIPNKMLRNRDTDVLSVPELASQNLQFRNRLLMGSSWRSDIITANELGFEKVSEIENVLGCSHEPAHRITKEFRIVLATRVGSATNA